MRCGAGMLPANLAVVEQTTVAPAASKRCAARYVVFVHFAGSSLQ